MITHRNTYEAFTLIELLCVMSIIAFLAALSVPAMQQSSVAQIATSGARISGLMQASRETAILTRQPVAVAMLTPQSNSPVRFTTLKYVPATSGTIGTWKQMSKWESLPIGILPWTGEDSSGNPINALQPNNSPSVGAALPPLVYSGVNYRPGTGYGYVIFLPDGSLFKSGGYPATPCILELTQGIMTTGGSLYQGAKHTNSDGTVGPANYIQIVLNDATGQAKIVQP